MRSTATHSSPRSAIVFKVRFAPVLLVLFAAGCRTGRLPDPNDVVTAGPDTPSVIQAQLQSAADGLNYRKSHKELNDRQYAALMTKIARDYIAQAKDATVTDRNAAAWGDIYVTAKEWPQAESALTIAVKNEQVAGTRNFVALGNWVGDSMHLARVKAELGKVPEAIAVARSVFGALPKAKAPILPAVLYEIVPAGMGKGSDLALADLLKDAIAQHESALVDPNTEGGRDFLLARPHHIQRAWELAEYLYQTAGRPDLAQGAATRAKSMAQTNIRV